jgi:hypothetical protein
VHLFLKDLRTNIRLVAAIFGQFSPLILVAVCKEGHSLL